MRRLLFGAVWKSLLVRRDGVASGNVVGRVVWAVMNDGGKEKAPEASIAGHQRGREDESSSKCRR